MTTCADVVARVLKEAGVTRIFGLPGGEILDFMEAARRQGIAFLLTRQESTAAFMADVTGQISGTPGVCVATLGPGAVNMTLGVANAYLDRSPLIAITATHALAAAPYATHQNLDLNAVYRPFTKLAITLDGTDTAAAVRHAIDVSLAPRRGPVHIAIPSDVARMEDRATGAAPRAVAPSGTRNEVRSTASRPHSARRDGPSPSSASTWIRVAIPPPCASSSRPSALPVFVTPKAKGIFPEDHPLFHGVCAGVSGDGRVVDFLAGADLLLGIGFEPVESDKLWHHTMPLVSVGPHSIAAGAFRPRAEATGDLVDLLQQLRQRVQRSFEWQPADRAAFRDVLEGVLKPAAVPRGLSGYELTRQLRRRFPRDTDLHDRRRLGEDDHVTGMGRVTSR